MRAEDQFHVGVVVHDLQGTRSLLTDLFGYTWTPELTGEVSIVGPGGPDRLSLTLLYSRCVPRVELVQEIPGTLWVPADSGVHHIGYWSDDVPGDSARLAQAGYHHEASGLDGDGHPYWAYHRSPTGPRIELVSRGLAATMESLWGPPPA